MLGKFGAMLLMQEFPGRGIARALIVLPWAVPVSLATLAWLWMFDSLYSVINWTLVAHRPDRPATRAAVAGQQDLAMIAVTVVQCLALVSVRVVIFLAGFTSVPKDILDAATIDGAGFWRRNYQIILPIIAPIIVIALIFGTVFTFTDLSVVYLLTKGGPIGGTHVLGIAGLSGRYPVGRRRPRRCHLAVPVSVPFGRGHLSVALAPAPGDLRCRGSPEKSPAKVRFTRRSRSCRLPRSRSIGC